MVDCHTRVLGRAGKATGKHKNWYNLQHIEPDGSNGQKESVDMPRVDNLNIQQETMDADILISLNVAKQEEIKRLISTGPAPHKRFDSQYRSQALAV